MQNAVARTAAVAALALLAHARPAAAQNPPDVLFQMDGIQRELAYAGLFFDQYLLQNYPLANPLGPTLSWSKSMTTAHYPDRSVLTGSAFSNGSGGDGAFTINEKAWLDWTHPGGGGIIFGLQFGGGASINAYVRGKAGTPFRIDLNNNSTFVDGGSWLSSFGVREGGNPVPDRGAYVRHGVTQGEPILYNGQEYTYATRIDAPADAGLAFTQIMFVPAFNLFVHIDVDLKGALERLDREPAPGDDDRGPYQCFGDTNLNLSGGNGHNRFPDPVPTRGWPLVNNIHVDTQAVERDRPLGNATFTYDIHVTRQTNIDGPAEKWVVVDGDATRIVFGPTSAAPTPAPGVFSRLRQSATGFTLDNAGPPERIDRAGNFAYAFDTQGKLLSVTDPAGNRQTIEYDASGLPTRVFDASSRKQIVFVASAGRIVRILENGNAAYVDLSYSQGLLTRAISRTGPVSATAAALLDRGFSYDGLGRPTSIVDYVGGPVETRISYSDYGVSRVPMANLSIPGGPSTAIDWLSSPGGGFYYRAIRTTATGGQILYDFDKRRNLRRITYPKFAGAPAPTVYQIAVDANRNVTSVSDGTVSWNITYAPNGTVTRLTNGAGSSWTYGYAGVDLKSVTDKIGLLESYAYTDPRLPHHPTAIADAEGATYASAYNAFGQPVQITPPAGSPEGTTSLLYTEDTRSKAYGWLRQITNGAGESVFLDAYTPLGDVSSLTTLSDAATPSTTVLFYDGLRRLTLERHPDGTSRRVLYTGALQRREIDEAGRGATWRFCVCGKPLSLDRGNGWKVSWALDRDFQVTRFTDARQFSTQYAYGLAGELTGIVYPDGSTRKLWYDSTGRVRQSVNGRGQAQNRFYDRAGRVTKQTSPSTGAPDRVYTYYADNRLKDVRSGEGVVSYTYWPSRRLRTVVYDWRASGLAALQRLDYAYFPDGRLLSLTWTSGANVVGAWTYGYDAAGRMASATNLWGERTVYAYDGEGKRVRQTNANGTSTAYRYNEARDWPTRIVHSRGATAFASYDLTYDNGADTVGNLTGVTEADGSAVTYAYDALDRLTGEQRTGLAPYTRTYQYDLAGNPTHVNGAVQGLYDGANKLTHLTGKSISHDADGNVVGLQGAGLPLASLAWDERSKLQSVSEGGRAQGYGYDVFGRRLWAQSPGGARTFFVFHGDLLLGEVDATGALLSAYTWGADGLVSQRLVGLNRSLWYHFGPQGETRQLTNGSGGVVNEYVYTAYGLPAYFRGANPNPFRYGGKFGYYSDSTRMGLILCGARWYSPHAMRWLSRDPSGFAGGDNLYRYAASSPTMFADFNGRHPAIIFLAWMAYELLNPTPLEEPWTIGDEFSHNLDAAMFAASIGRSVRPTGARPPQTCPDNLSTLMKDADLVTRQEAISKPMVDRYVNMIRQGQTPPPIVVDGNIIIDGNHRYVAGIITGKLPSMTPGTSPTTPKPIVSWINVLVSKADWGGW